MRKLLSLLLSAALVLSMVPAMAFTASAADDTIEGVVTEMTVKGNTIYVYAPKSELPVVSATTAPCFMVFGDEPYTAETAEATALASGLAKLAAQEGATVVFINPQGDAWGEADKDSYVSMIDMYSNSSGADFVNGITKSVNFMTKQEETKIMGANEARIYLYAEGSGADFVAANYMKAVKLVTTFPDGFSMEFDRTPTTVTLFNPTALPAAEGPASLAVAVVNGPADTADKLAGLTDKTVVATSKVTDGFDGQWIADNYKTISGAYRSQAGQILPMHDYAAEGIVESMESMESAQLRNGATTLNYVVYYDKNLNVHDPANPVPLVLAFHGGGNSALFEAQATEWPEIAKAHGFIAVCVDLHHPNSTAAQTIELIDHLKEKYAIDASRIYASGFSMGSVKSWDLFEQYATVFAGLAPMDATEAPGTDSYGKVWDSYNTDVLVPLFFVGGQTSPLPELPCQAEKVVERVAYAFSVNNVAQKYSYSDAVNHWWGVNGDIVYQVTDKAAFTDSTLTVNLFQSADGKCYTALADASNQSHEVYARNSWAAWDFLSQFSRNADGSISIAPVTYSLASDDGAVTNNSYNTYSSYYYDVNVYTPHASEIQKVTEAGLMQGVDYRRFSPETTVTRAQAAAVLYRMAGSPAVKVSAPFTDVSAKAWYATCIDWAYANGILVGTGNGLVAPTRVVTSAELDLMLTRYAQGVGARYTSSSSTAKTVNRGELAYRLANLVDAVKEAEEPMTTLAYATTTNGPIMGYTEAGISRFYGIPYAKAERFHMPEDPDPWTNIKTTMMPGEVAPQNKTTMEVFDFMFYANENVENEKTMLNLNVFTTNLDKAETAKPVIVWMHGGGYSTGSSMEKTFYEGADLANYGDVVFVSVNHRLNCLGYLDLSAYGEEYANSANLGQADLVKALEWVRDNISNFGGDPKNVTIVGQSGGGGKVTTLMSMPSAKGLFHKAMAISGGSAQITRTHEQAQAQTAKVLEILGITAANIKDIETIPYTELYAACAEAGVSYGPVADGKYVYSTYEMSANIPFMAGNVLGEFSTNIGNIIFSPNQPAIESNVLTNITEEDVVSRLATQHDGNTELAKSIVAAFKEAYPGHNPAEVLYINNRERGMSAIPLAAAMESCGGTVYSYIQAAPYPFFGGIVPIHTAGDIPLWFHNVDMIPAWVNSQTAEFKALSDEMATALCNFAYTGNPTSDDLEWKPWTSEEDGIMVFDLESGMRYHHEDALFRLMNS